MNAPLLALLLAASAQAQPRASYPPKRLALVRAVASVKAAPTGREAYFATDITGAMELWKVPASGGWPTQLTELGGRRGRERHALHARRDLPRILA